MSQASFTFQDNAPVQARKHRRGRGYNASSNGHEGKGKPSGSDQPDSTSCAGSLTYSASSSINSGLSSAGESTDSSFADIMRVLDLDQDTSELAAIMAKDGGDLQHQLLMQRAENQRRSRRSVAGSSVADSLIYSDDGESVRNMPETITGQPSDSNAPDGGSSVGGNSDIMFAPADPAERKREASKRSKRSGSNTPRTKGGSSRSRIGKDSPDRRSDVSDERRLKTRSSSDGSVSTPTSAPPSSSKPPSSKSSKKKSSQKKVQDEVFYSKWWMCGFTDAFKNFAK